MNAAQIVLEVHAVDKRLGHHTVLQGVTFSLAAGSVSAVVGTNGSGKSTLLRVLSGQLYADAGTVTVCGIRLGDPKRDARQHLAFVPDHTEAFPDLSGYEFLMLMYALRHVTPTDSDASNEAQLGLAEFAGRRMKALSFGQRKRVCLAAALAGSPPLLLLDEPTNGLDAQGCTFLAQAVGERARRGLATLATTHDATMLRSWQPRLFRIAGGTVEPHETP